MGKEWERDGNGVGVGTGTPFRDKHRGAYLERVCPSSLPPRSHSVPTTPPFETSHSTLYNNKRQIHEVNKFTSKPIGIDIGVAYNSKVRIHVVHMNQIIGKIEKEGEGGNREREREKQNNKKKQHIMYIIEQYDLIMNVFYIVKCCYVLANLL